MQNVVSIPLARGTACLRCRKLKAKCTGSRPRCGRCQRLKIQCFYTNEAAQQVAHDSPPEILQARALELQLAINKVLLSSKHDLLLISAGLRERINRLGAFYGQPQPTQTSIPLYICCEDGKLDVLASRLSSSRRNLSIDPQVGDTCDAEIAIVEHTLDSFQWTKGEELPLPMSLYLIGIFLPYRSHFNFYIPLPEFLPRLSLPLSHPSSIHPCLRSALHLASCSILGGHWADLELYFTERTRHFLEEALMFANSGHITQFLWASVLFASYLARAQRVGESYAIISPASQLVTACGLGSTHNPEVDRGYRPDQFLLPPPATEAEAIERIWLAQSVFITDRSLSVLAGCAGTFVCDPRWRPVMDEPEITYPWFKSLIISEESLSKMWQSEMHRNVSITHLFIEVITVSRSVRENQSILDETELMSLKSFIRFHDSRIPPLSGTPNDSNSNILLSHATLYGSSAILHSHFARKNAKARREMLRCAQKLVEICKQLQGHRDLRVIQSSLVPMFHMMNAIRILAHELRRSAVQENAALSTEYCHSIEVLLDFLGGMTTLYPA